MQFEDTMDELAEKILDFSISDSTRIQEPFTFEMYSDSTSEVLLRLPLDLKNSAAVYQELYSAAPDLLQQVPLGGPLQGLVFTSTPEGNIMHWPLQDAMSSSRVVSMLSQLPFRQGFPLPAIE
jgi:hypothetical protein